MVEWDGGSERAVSPRGKPYPPQRSEGVREEAMGNSSYGVGRTAKEEVYTWGTGQVVKNEIDEKK